MGEPSMGFRHISPEYWISRDVDSAYTVGADQMVVIEGTNNLTGNGGTGGYDLLAHIQYFQGNLGACTLDVLDL